MHSCIAGFAEAGESIEETVRREAFEEAGIVVDRVAYHSSQPWVRRVHTAEKHEKDSSVIMFVDRSPFPTRSCWVLSQKQ